MPARLFVCLAPLLIVFTACKAPTLQEPLATLRTEHPRVLATQNDFDRIARLVKTDPRAKQWYARLKERAPELLAEPVVEYNLRDGRRLLYESRGVADRVLTLGLLDRLEPNDRYRDRIWQDLQAAAGFDSWNPDHFLDVAEMAFAFGIAYDWLYDRWTPAQRKTIREAIVRHGLEPAFRAYEKKVWWTRTHINWNQVCNGGLIAAALAIADDAPKPATRMLQLGVKALEIPMARYAPDGGYQEGPGYWGYGTIYNIIAIASLESALGTDFGLADKPGFGQTASFPVQMIGTSGKFFNFGDNRERVSASPAVFWFAQRFLKELKPAYFMSWPSALYLLDKVKASPMTLLWYDPNVAEGQYIPDLKANYRSAGVAVMRTGWGQGSTFVGVKGGSIGFGHSQMDLGSFVLDHGGVRWFVDLGSDNYNLPGYFHSDKGSGRWRYYRNRAEGHNTLVINPDKTGGQDYDAKAKIKATDDLNDWSMSVDLSQAYPGKIQRAFKHYPGGQAYTVLTDTVALDKPSELWWFAHTKAEVELAKDGRSAQLMQGGKRMNVRIVSPKEARFTVMAARPLASSPDPAGQNPNNGAVLINTARGSKHTRRGERPKFGEPDPAEAVRKLAIHLQGVEATTIQVVFTPAK